jgi:hypothetical protein
VNKLTETPAQKERLVADAIEAVEDAFAQRGLVLDQALASHLRMLFRKVVAETDNGH